MSINNNEWDAILGNTSLVVENDNEAPVVGEVAQEEAVVEEVHEENTEEIAPEEAKKAELKELAKELKIKESKKPEEASAEEEVPQDPFSRKFAALSKREKRFVEREKQFKQRESEYEQMKARLAELEKPKVIEEPKKAPIEDRLRQDPIGTLEELGLSFEDLLEFQLNGKKPTADFELKNIKSELTKLREEQERRYKEELENLKKDMEAKEQKRLQEEQDRQINYFKNIVVAHVEAEQSNFPHIMVSDINIADEVCELIGAHYNQTGESLDMVDALDLIEAELKERADRYRAISIGTPNKTSTQQQMAAPKAKKAPIMQKTLTNASSVTNKKKTYASQEEELRDLASLLKTYDS